MNLLKPLLLLTNNLFSISLAILGIGFIIGFHELGHFLFGKLFKIKAPSFSIGFGPKIYKKKIGETVFSVSAIPLGGYVETDKESFESKPYYQKMLVIGGGILFNLLFAYFVLCMLFVVGMPKTVPKIESISKKTEIANLGLKPNDTIMSINDQKIEGNLLTFYEKLKEYKGEDIRVGLERGIKTTEINIPKKQLIKALSGGSVAFKSIQGERLPFFTAIKKGINLTNEYIIRTLSIFKYIFVKRDISGVGGPVMIISETIKSASRGIKIFLLFLALISISLAVINLIPIPILDGGQALLYSIEAIIGRKIPDKPKEYILIGSWIFMLVIFVLITGRDIWKIITPYIQKFTGK